MSAIDLRTKALRQARQVRSTTARAASAVVFFSVGATCAQRSAARPPLVRSASYHPTSQSRYGGPILGT
eukprot:4174447-Pyramimonas_sp.AAC.1